MDFIEIRLPTATRTLPPIIKTTNKTTMSILKNIFGLKKSKENEFPERIIITCENIDNWSKFDQLYKNGKIKEDSKGRLRYLHGAPVGELVLVRIDKNGKPIYKESASEWFDPESQKAREFIWT